MLEVSEVYLQIGKRILLIAIISTFDLTPNDDGIGTMSLSRLVSWKFVLVMRLHS